MLDPLSSSENDAAGEDRFCCIRDLDSGKRIVVHDLGPDGLLSMLKEAGSDHMITRQEFETCLGLSSSFQQFMRRENSCIEQRHIDASDMRKKKSTKWWMSLKMKTYVSGYKLDATRKSNKLPRMVRVKSTTTMQKASGGEDCVLRIWKVREVEPFCKCLLANGSFRNDNKVRDRKSLVKENNINAPVVIPKKVFVIEETPLHEYSGHANQILDLTWSTSDALLTSSKDRTIRMWKIGGDGCLKVFQHNDYVTCVQFNPADERYFISGSIDGKVRIWGIAENRVVDWVDICDIVTSLCFQPDGRGFFVGSVSGDCRFYDYSGDIRQLDKHFCVQGKKKSTVKPVMGLQLTREDSRRLMVTSLYSKLRIYDEVDSVCKFRGLRNCKSQFSASFTSDGRHIVSVGDDSHVYIWNYNEATIPCSRGVKSIRSCEHFFSEGVSVAIPWPGLEQRGLGMSNDTFHAPAASSKLLGPACWLRDPDCFSLGIWFFTDGSARISPTWVEEKSAC